MKLKYFFWAGILAAGITACSDKEELSVSGQESSKVNAYMTLQIMGPQTTSGSRTAANPNGDGDGSHSGDTQIGTTGENTISSVTIYLCNPQDHKVVESYSVSSGLVSIDGGVKTPVIQTKTGEYEVFVIANAPTNLSIAEGEVITNEVISGINEKAMQDTYAKLTIENGKETGGSFLMFNECNASDDTDGASIEISTDNDYDHPATCETIMLDRLAVKIKSQIGDNVNIDGINKEGELNVVEKVELEGFKLLNGVTKANLQQKWSKTITEQGSYPWSNILQTPALDNNSTGYYNHLSSFRTIETKDDATVYTKAMDLYETVPSYNENDPDGVIYCMENNNENSVGDQYGTTTGLVYKWKVTIKDKEGQTDISESDECAGKNCFYAYDGKYYATLSALITDYPGIVANVTGADLNAKIEAVEKELQDASAKTAGTERETAISNFRAKYKIKVYTDGIMYYTYFIKDQNYRLGTNQNVDEDHYYSVMRNTVYDLTVTKLQRIGTDIPGGWNPDVDPEDPVDPTNVYMVIETKANPWVVSKEDITLK